nr:hypothetical protein [Tanacetum cinerariifolium]
MIAFLTKSAVSEGFDQIVDFLTTHTIQYALMVNPTIYVSCIKQFWASVLIKKSNNAVKLQALIDKKKCMSAKRTTWNEFSSSMASAVICLAIEEDEDDNEVSTASTSPSPTYATIQPSPQQEPIPSPPQAQPTQPSSPPQQQPTQPANTSKSSLTLLNTLMETCATLTQKVTHLEQDKVAQALEITKLKQRVRKLEKKIKFKSFGLKRLKKVEGGIAELDADEDVTLVDVDADTQWRMEEDVTTIKDINAAESEPTVFNDEKVTMSMAQTLIKMKADKARILDEQMAKRLQDEETEQAAARKIQEKEDLERAKVLQQQYDQKQEDIDWNIVAEKMQEKHLDNVKKYQSLKRKPISVAQARKNMIVYLKNMAGYKIQHFKGMTYDQVRPFFEREYKHVQTFLKSDRDEEPTKKRHAKETLLQESFKKLKAEVKVSSSHSTQEETPIVDPAEISQEDIQNMLQIVPMAEFKVEALQVKVGGITQAFQSFKDMLKDFDREDWDALWRIIKEKFSTTMRTHKMHPNSGVHQVSSTTRRYDIYILAEKDYPLSNQVMTLMPSSILQVEEDSEAARDLVMKIFLKANQPKSKRNNNKGNDKKRKGTLNSSKDNKKDKKPLSEDESANAVEQVDTTEITVMVSKMNIGMIQELYMASVTTTDDCWYDSGIVEIQLTYVKKLILMNGLYVPNIRKNLVSGFKLCKSGVKAVIELDKMKDMNEVDTILEIKEANTPYESSCKLVENDGRAVAQIEYVSAIGYSDASWITSSSDSKSTTGWIFTLGGEAFCWGSKKQTCITHSTMEVEFLALADAGKKAEWLKNMLLDIELWPQPMPSIFLHCDSSQRYEGHIIRCIIESLDTLALYIKELISNGIITIEYIRSCKNLVDPFTKGLPNDIVFGATREMGLKPIE